MVPAWSIFSSVVLFLLKLFILHIFLYCTSVLLNISSRSFYFSKEQVKWSSKSACPFTWKMQREIPTHLLSMLQTLWCWRRRPHLLHVCKCQMFDITILNRYLHVYKYKHIFNILWGVHLETVVWSTLRDHFNFQMSALFNY